MGGNCYLGSFAQLSIVEAWCFILLYCMFSQVHCLQCLLTAGCELVVDKSGDTPANIARIYGHTDCVKLIQEHLEPIPSKCSIESCESTT